MRHSFLYLDRHRARLIGIAGFGTIIFVVGAFFILSASPGKRAEQQSLSIPLTGIGLVERVSGPVYWLNETEGAVSVVGSFTLEPSGGRMKILMPKPYTDQKQLFTGSYWSGHPGSYVPHFQFLFNADLNHRLQQVFRSAEADEAVQSAVMRFGETWIAVMNRELLPELRRLVDTPGFRHSLIDAALAFALNRLVSTREDDAKASGHFGDEARNQIYRVLRDHVSENIDQWTRSLMDDSEMRQSFDALMAALEPHFRSAMTEILWTSAPDLAVPGLDGTPNARVLWVARRIMFGSRSPAILLAADPQGVPLSKRPFPCRVAP